MIMTKFGKAKKNNKGHLVITSGVNINKKLHRLVYEDYHNYTIPDDYDIHHIDEDKTNNTINNLIMLKHSEHTTHHKSSNEYRIIKKGINNGEQLYGLYSPDGEKLRTSKDKEKLERIKDRLINDSLLKEKPQHNLIFEEYYNMGDRRTLTALAHKTGYSISTLSRWNRMFEWDKQIQNRNKGKLQLIQADRLEANKTARCVYQNTIREILRQQVIEPLQNGILDIEVKNVSDIKRLMELDHMLSQEDKLEEKEDKLNDTEKGIVDLIENDKDVWQMMTDKLKNIKR